jgi:hypothetical protein
MARDRLSRRAEISGEFFSSAEVWRSFYRLPEL